MLNDKYRKCQWRAVRESDGVFDNKQTNKQTLNREATHINFYQLDLCAQRLCKCNSKKKISTVERRIGSTIPS